MSTTLETHFVVTDRVVLTYERNGWPAAVVTGYEDGRGGFHVEHMITLTGGALRRLLSVGLGEAWSRGYEYVAFSMPQGFPLAGPLTRIARHLGFTPYASAHGFDFWVRYAP